MDSADSVVDFEHSLDDYVPAKKRYNFYFTDKIVHPWWDAVALGMEDAQKKYLEKGMLPVINLLRMHVLLYVIFLFMVQFLGPVVMSL